ncbi:MAG: hypothetical protein LAP87_27920 [Acidobacteriia bacterium]|nr:hypothetical protein [Terriglobia bacterium]
MRLPRILNQCHPIPGFVYGQASFAQDQQAVLILAGAAVLFAAAYVGRRVKSNADFRFVKQ